MTTSRRQVLISGAAIGLGCAAVAAGCAGGGSSVATEPGPGTPSTQGMRDIDSVALSRLMGVGWNLGNSLEATGGETAWGNAATTPALMNAVRAAGFGTVRIPVSWKQYASADDVIGAAWLARVAEVVGMARSAGLFAIINIHWDGGWMQPLYARQVAVNARIRSFWTQIAQHFREHDDSLLFAGTNEVMKEGDYGTPTAEYTSVQNSFNQTFVDAVRATGGNNRVRHLVVQGFNTNIDHTLAFAVLPTDPTPKRLMMEVHYYDPYNFTLNEKSNIWQWGAGTTDASATEAWANEAHLETQMRRMQARYLDQGVAVILGEYGVIARPEIPGAEAYRLDWNRAVTRAARARGLVPVYWDNGVTGGHGMGLFDRRSGAQIHPALIQALVNAGA